MSGDPGDGRGRRSRGRGRRPVADDDRRGGDRGGWDDPPDNRRSGDKGGWDDPPDDRRDDDRHGGDRRDDRPGDRWDDPPDDRADIDRDGGRDPGEPRRGRGRMRTADARRRMRATPNAYDAELHYGESNRRRASEFLGLSENAVADRPGRRWARAASDPDHSRFAPDDLTGELPIAADAFGVAPESPGVAQQPLAPWMSVRSFNKRWIRE